MFCYCNRAISQIPQCTCPIAHNVSFRTEMCTFMFWMVQCGMWDRCIVAFMRLVYCHTLWYGISYKVRPWYDIKSMANKDIQMKWCSIIMKTFTIRYMQMMQHQIEIHSNHMILKKAAYCGSPLSGLNIIKTNQIIWRSRTSWFPSSNFCWSKNINEIDYVTQHRSTHCCLY